MSKEEPELLGYHGAECPHCKKAIYIPDYRGQPVTGDDLKKYGRKVIESMRREKKK